MCTTHSLHEVLARDIARERRARSSQRRLAGELRAVRGWHRVSRYAAAAEARHADRAQRAVNG